jgi:hypothetical protein
MGKHSIHPDLHRRDHPGIDHYRDGVLMKTLLFLIVCILCWPIALGYVLFHVGVYVCLYHALKNDRDRIEGRS